MGIDCANLINLALNEWSWNSSPLVPFHGSRARVVYSCDKSIFLDVHFQTNVCEGVNSHRHITVVRWILYWYHSDSYWSVSLLVLTGIVNFSDFYLYFLLIFLAGEVFIKVAEPNCTVLALQHKRHTQDGHVPATWSTVSDPMIMWWEGQRRTLKTHVNDCRS